MSGQAGAETTRVGRALRQSVIPRQRIGRQLAAISMFDAVGSGMYYTGSALYFTTIVGLSPGQVGAGLSAGAAAGLLGAVPIGMLADRIRTGHVYIWLQLLRGLAFAGFCLISSFPPFVVVCAFAGLTEAALPPVQQAVVGATVPGADRVDTLAKIRAVRNAGFGLGALIATAAIEQGSKAAFLTLVAGNAVSYFGVAAALARIGASQVTARVDPARRPAVRFVPDGWYALTGLLSGALSVHSTLLVVALPLWFVRHTPMPRALVGILVAVNTAMAVLLQARFARSSSDVPGSVRAARYAGLALAAFGVACMVAPGARSVAVAVALAFAALILLTLAELWQSASGWSLSYELADPARRTVYLSTFQLGQSLQAAAAPWIITSVVFRVRGGWLLFGAVVLAAGLLTRGAAGRRRSALAA